MPITEFPDPNYSTPEGIVALGGDLHPQSLLLAYRMGIFPWPVEDLPLPWFCPPVRAILKFEDLKVPKSLAKLWKKVPYRFTIDRAFSQVIRECAKIKRAGQRGTWITPEMLKAYIEFHQLGHAHSVEVWEDKKLVGGLYGVEVEGIFSGESMFHEKPNASKFALLFLIEHLKKAKVEWIDIQQLTPHMEALGAKEIPREEFLKLLARTQKKKLKGFA